MVDTIAPATLDDIKRRHNAPKGLVKPRKSPLEEMRERNQANFKLTDWLTPGQSYTSVELKEAYSSACNAFVGAQFREAVQAGIKSSLITAPNIFAEKVQEEVDFMQATIMWRRGDDKDVPPPGVLVLHDAPQDNLVETMIQVGAVEVSTEPMPPFWWTK